MSAYIPSASVSDGPEDQHCLPCSVDPARTFNSDDDDSAATYKKMRQQNPVHN